eukprot:Tamp_11055.p1 GENE.Tamp_11055~~Tamp_11055.p1  ORF type:complete len:534 (+),score=1.69 Tamp_11055:105-1604(+)
MGEVQSVCISGSKDNQGTRMQAATHPAHRVPGPIRAPVNASRSAERLPTPPPLGPPAAGPEKPVQLTAEKSVSFGHRYETHYTTERADSGASGIVDVGFPALNSQHIAGLSGFMSVPPSPERPKASGSTTLPGHWHSPQKQVPGIARAQGSAPFALPPTDEPKLHSLPLSQSPPAVSPGPQVAIGVQRSVTSNGVEYATVPITAACPQAQRRSPPTSHQAPQVQSPTPAHTPPSPPLMDKNSSSSQRMPLFRPSHSPLLGVNGTPGATGAAQANARTQSKGPLRTAPQQTASPSSESRSAGNQSSPSSSASARPPDANATPSPQRARPASPQHARPSSPAAFYYPQGYHNHAHFNQTPPSPTLSAHRPASPSMQYAAGPYSIPSFPTYTTAPMHAHAPHSHHAAMRPSSPVHHALMRSPSPLQARPPSAHAHRPPSPMPARPPSPQAHAQTQMRHPLHVHPSPPLSAPVAMLPSGSPLGARPQSPMQNHPSGWAVVVPQ